MRNETLWRGNVPQEQTDNWQYTSRRLQTLVEKGEQLLNSRSTGAIRLSQGFRCSRKWAIMREVEEGMTNEEERDRYESFGTHCG
jgi:hypothetical protein